jgi:hypothetical protein
MRPLYPRFLIVPPSQVVPAATGIKTTLPLLQRPNFSGPSQTIAPFSVQVEPPEGVPEDGAPVLPGGEIGAPVPTGEEVLVERVVGATLEAPGAKTPPPVVVGS